VFPEVKTNAKMRGWKKKVEMGNITEGVRRVKREEDVNN